MQEIIPGMRLTLRDAVFALHRMMGVPPGTFSVASDYEAGFSSSGVDAPALNWVLSIQRFTVVKWLPKKLRILPSHKRHGLPWRGRYTAKADDPYGGAGVHRVIEVHASIVGRDTQPWILPVKALLSHPKRRVHRDSISLLREKFKMRDRANPGVTDREFWCADVRIANK